MNQDRSLLWPGWLLTAALTLGGGMNLATAQTTPVPGEAVSARASASSVEWSPKVANSGGLLTIAGRSFRLEKTFDAGRNPRFALSDVEGGNLPDGVYQWELRFNLVNPPMVETENNGRDGRRVNVARNGVVASGEVTPNPTVVSGGFTVLNGSIVDSGRQEPEPAAK